MDLDGPSSHAQVLNFSQAFFCLPWNLTLVSLLQKAKRCQLRVAVSQTQIIPATPHPTIPIISLSRKCPAAEFQGFSHIPAIIFPAVLLCLCLLHWSTSNTSTALEPGLYLCSFTIKPCSSVGTSAHLCSTQTPHTFFRNFSFYKSGCFLPAAMYTLDMLRKSI